MNDVINNDVVGMQDESSCSIIFNGFQVWL